VSAPRVADSVQTGLALSDVQDCQVIADHESGHGRRRATLVEDYARRACYWRLVGGS
jgi:hypothetical protein